jgi:spermidine synthase
MMWRGASGTATPERHDFAGRQDQPLPSAVALPITRQPVAALFLLFTVSGFTGLIYESLWSHYLMLFLGHAAFAQSFVLIVFMGGVALGAWLASRFTARSTNLLGWYGVTEALIGLFALGFHPVFVWLMDVSLSRVFPGLGGPVVVEVYKLSISALLLLPATVLLGMTFPLMSGAVIRRSPTDTEGRSASGHHLAMLYFTNSIGAAAGALASGFWLIGALGLPGTMQLAGKLNLLLACLVYWYARVPETPLALPAATTEPARDVQARLLLGAAFVTGAASFIYEIAWIRMLALVLGSSFQAFELMLSAFITGLALGGLWIWRRIDRLADPLRFSGYVQLSMGLLALATIVVYHVSFDWMQWLLGALGRSDSSYALFNLGSHAIAFAIMLPATFMAGMTLPLFTHVLLRRGHGERSIGQVYAANTVGAIAGVVVAVHVLLPHTGLKLALAIGALLDMLLGARLLGGSAHRRRRVENLGAAAVGILSVALVAHGVVLDPVRLSSGVFRYGRADQPGVDVVYYRDGKTASVALRRFGDLLTVTTNGKPDAGVEVDPGKPAAPDESTMTLMSAIPLLLKPDARSIAIIGFGSGMTAEVALSLTSVQRVDTIEIEPAMVEAGRGFFPRVRRPFEDPRSRIHIEDAKSYFARHQSRYDLILSEPSNPWVNGVASLFSTDFYRDVKRYLKEGGLFVQWIQLYELDDRLFASILGALGENFADYAIYETARNADVIVVASPSWPVPRLGELPASENDFLWQLRRVGVVGRADLEARRTGTKDSLGPLLAFLDTPVNSDFQPILQIEAPRARFEARRAQAVLEAITLAPLPVYEMLADPTAAFIDAPAPLARSERVIKQNQAIEIHHALLSPRSEPLGAVDPSARAPLLALRQSRAFCGATVEPLLIEQLHWIAERTLPHLGPERRRELWVDAGWLGCRASETAPAVRARLALYRAIAERDASAMYARATEMLAAPGPAAADWERFLLSTAMLGALGSGRRDKARELWVNHAPRLYPDKRFPPYVVLLSHWHRHRREPGVRARPERSQPGASRRPPPDPRDSPQGTLTASEAPTNVHHAVACVR